MTIRPYERRAKYYETDQMAIIHHSNYIRWMEEARIDWMEQIGCSYRMLEETGIMIPVLSVSCEYRTAVRFDDVVEIHLQVTKFNGVKMAISYEIYDKETKELRTKGESGHGFVSAAAFKPISLKRSYPDIYAKFMEHIPPLAEH